jgi:hypothetical protein
MFLRKSRAAECGGNHNNQSFHVSSLSGRSACFVDATMAPTHI